MGGNKVRKLIAAIVLIFLLFLAAYALAWEEYELPEGEQSVYGLAQGNDERLALMDRRLYRLNEDMTFELLKEQSTAGLRYIDYQTAGPEAKARYEELIGRLFSGDDGIYTYNSYTRRILKWNGSAFVALPIDLSEAEEADEFYGSFVAGGKLYGLVNEADDYREALCTIDLKTGGQSLISLPDGVDYIEEMCAYKDGLVLLLYQDPENNYFYSLRSFDPAKGEVTDDLAVKMESYNCGGLVYDAPTDTAYYMECGQVIGVRDGQQEVLAYLPLDFTACALLLPDGRYLATYRKIIVTELDSSNVPGVTLRVSGYYANEATNRFARENPDVALLLVDDYYSGSEELAQAIQSGDASTDIFAVGIGYGLSALMRKGFAEPIQSAYLNEQIGAFYPALKAPLYNEQGELCAVPYEFYVRPWGVDAALWERLGLGDYPTTYGELLDLMAMWEADYAGEHPDITFYPYWGQEELVRELIEAYIRQYEGEELLSFNTPVLREVLEKVEKLTAGEVGRENMTEAEREALSRRMNQRCLIDKRIGGVLDEGGKPYHSGDGDEAGRVLLLTPLTFEAGQEPVMEASGDVYIVNPLSENKEAAVRFLEVLVKSQMDGTLWREETPYIARPDWNDPVRERDFDKRVMAIEKDNEELKAAREWVSDVDKPEIDADIAYYEEWLAHQEEYQWQFTPEGIAGYRRVGAYARTDAHSRFLTNDGKSGMSELRGVISRYADGQLTLDAFLRELDQKAKMIYLEGR